MLDLCKLLFFGKNISYGLMVVVIVIIYKFGEKICVELLKYYFWLWNAKGCNVLKRSWYTTKYSEKYNCFINNYFLKLK